MTINSTAFKFDKKSQDAHKILQRTAKRQCQQSEKS